MQAGYGYQERKHLSTSFRLGEGLVGQCAVEKERILLTDAPSDYVRINSGLGEAAPLNIIVLPILFEGSVRAVIELASFAPFSATHQSFLDQLTESIGLVLNTVEATSVTEVLLEQAQSQAQELQSGQEQLQQSNYEVRARYEEVEAAKRLVEDKASQLAVASKYKSEFIANMSHELRTPLNSLLVLAEQLEDNPDGNLNERQVEYARVIRSSGVDLLNLLNDILDLAKVESKTVQLEMGEVALADLRDSSLQSFQHLADGQQLTFSVELDEALPVTMVTDALRLRQIFTNLLSNAFKFTERGEVAMRFSLVTSGWSPDSESLARASSVVAIAVRDTGIGIEEDRQSAMFEAFAQADGSTSRKYGGTGLGLSISRDIAALLGGEIILESELGAGSTFTVYLPLDHKAPSTSAPPSLPAAKSTNGHSPSNGHPPSPLPTQATPSDVGFHLNEETEGDAFFSGSEAGTTVLVVDDEYRNVFALTALLERGSIEVVAAESGPGALRELDERSDIDVVLMDIMMPEMNGYQTMTAIRELPDCADLPIVAVTGKVVEGERERCLAAGASDYIPKPVNTAELLTALSKWLPAQSVAGAP